MGVEGRICDLRFVIGIARSRCGEISFRQMQSAKPMWRRRPRRRWRLVTMLYSVRRRISPNEVSREAVARGVRRRRRSLMDTLPDNVRRRGRRRHSRFALPSAHYQSKIANRSIVNSIYQLPTIICLDILLEITTVCRLAPRLHTETAALRRPCAEGLFPRTWKVPLLPADELHVVER